ncbi:hypothetical protein H8356DRAFT_1424660 [Neocallimastix lanati (nom. inval.)]|nr:hypothetical protein H8356DRAFT_1424660 [Neocallimastix sp. JGI-2020a]
MSKRRYNRSQSLFLSLIIQNTYANLENKVRSYKPINNHHLDRWLNEGIILCKFCFTNPLFQSISTISNNSKSYYLLFEPFINNLVEYIFNDHPVVFMLFGSINSSIRKSINENKCSVVIISYPIKKYFKFKDSDYYVETQQLACNLRYTFKAVNTMSTYSMGIKPPKYRIIYINYEKEKEKETIENTKTLKFYTYVDANSKKEITKTLNKKICTGNPERENGKSINYFSIVLYWNGNHENMNFNYHDSSIFDIANWSTGNIFNCTFMSYNNNFEDDQLKITIDVNWSGYICDEYRIKNYYDFVPLSSPILAQVMVLNWMKSILNSLVTIPLNVTHYEHIHYLGFNASQGFHTYGFFWDGKHITRYVDGREVYTAYDNIPNILSKIMTNSWNSIDVNDWLELFNGSTNISTYYDWISYDAPSN